MRKNLIDECKRLTESEKRSLVRMLNAQINTQTTTRSEELLAVMEDVMGEKVDIRSREQRYVWARTIIANQLLSEGYSTTKVGMCLGMDHSSVVHMKKKFPMLFSQPKAFEKEREVFEKFNNIINHETA